MRTQGAAPLIEWGALILFATLAQAAVLGAALILAPLGAMPRGRTAGRPRLRIALYFGFIREFRGKRL